MTEENAAPPDQYYSEKAINLIFINPFGLFYVFHLFPIPIIEVINKSIFIILKDSPLNSIVGLLFLLTKFVYFVANK